MKPLSGRAEAKPLSVRFPIALQRRAVKVGTCHLWNGKNLRPKMRRDDGSYALVYTLVWESVNGPLPPGKQINHICDNGGCVNIDHLYCGTQSDNMRDARDRKVGSFYQMTAAERSVEMKKRWETRRRNALLA